MVHLWIVYCLSIIEQSCVVCGSSLIIENQTDLERTQKNFCKLMLEEDYHSYCEALTTSGLKTLSERRQKLTFDFAQRSLADDKFRDLFPIRKKLHCSTKRKSEQFRVNSANKNRYKHSPITTMQNMLNHR